MAKDDVGLFEYINIINLKGEYPAEFSGYSPYMINRAYSFIEETVLFANEINKPDVDPILNFDFYYYGLSKKKRFGKWSKKDKVKPDKTNRINNIIEYYNCSITKAQDIYEVLDKCGLMSEFDALVDKGGKTK